MKDFIKTFLITSVPFGIIMGAFFGIMGGLSKGLFGGVFCGLFFGTGVCIFIQWQKKKFKIKGMEITNSKPIIFDGGANHFKGKEGVGGWLYLTDDNVIFKSHAFNIQNHQTVIPLIHINQIKESATMGIIPNGLHIILKDGTTEKFVVNDRRKWIENIKVAISRSV